MGLSRPRDERKYPTAFDQQRELSELRHDVPWLADAPFECQQRLLVDLDLAWQRTFRSLAGRPHWKRRGDRAISLTSVSARSWYLRDDVLRFPKVGTMRVVAHRPLEGQRRTCTLILDGDQWFANIVCELDVPDPTPRTSPVIAIDRGITYTLADSDNVPSGHGIKIETDDQRRVLRLDNPLVQCFEASSCEAVNGEVRHIIVVKPGAPRGWARIKVDKNEACQ